MLFACSSDELKSTSRQPRTADASSPPASFVRAPSCARAAASDSSQAARPSAISAFSDGCSYTSPRPDRSTTSSPSRQPTRGVPPATEKTPNPLTAGNATLAAAGLRAVGACEPRQIREEAALSIPSQVRGPPGLKVALMRRSSLLGVVALAAIALAYAMPMRGRLPAERALRGHPGDRRGHPFIDRYANETCDLVRSNGHYYAAKGPRSISGRAVLSRPPRGACRAEEPERAPSLLRRDGRRSAPRRLADRALGRRAPALGLLLLIRRAVDRLEPGLGLAVACDSAGESCRRLDAPLPVSRRAGSHSRLRSLERNRSQLRRRPAGAAAGLAVATDLPLAVPAVCSASTPPRAATRRVRRLSRRASACPALDLQYLGVRESAPPRIWRRARPGRGRRLAADGLLRAGAAELPRARRGAPEPTRPARCHTGGGRGRRGHVLLWRRGLRSEAGLVATLAGGRADLELPRQPTAFAIGGWSPGPRFLIPLLRSLLRARARVRRRPATVGALALVSAGVMVVATSAEPLLQNDDTRHWLASGRAISPQPS